MKKTISFLLLVATFLLLFVSCGENQKTYRNDVSCENLYKNSLNVIKLEGDSLAFSLKSDLILGVTFEKTLGEGLSEDCRVAHTSGASFDEFGIFKVIDSVNVETVKNELLDYLKGLREDTTYRSYFPEEEYKLDESEVKVYGNYVVYAVLSQKNRTAFFDQIDNLLTSD